MGKLIRYEWKKTLGGRFFLLGLAVLLLVNVLLLCGLREWMDWQEMLENNVYGISVPEDEQTFWRYSASNRGVTDFLREGYALLGSEMSEERSAFVLAMREKYGEDVFETMSPDENMMESPGYFPDRSDFSAIFDYQSILSWNQDAREQFERVIKSAKSFGREALEKGDNYEIRRNLSIIRLYSRPRGEISAPIRGWDAYLFQTDTMLLVFLLILLGCAGSFSAERDRGTWLLLHTAKNGKGKTLAAKFVTGAALAAGVTILFQGSSLAAIWFRDGLLGANQPVSALEELRLFPWPIPLWQYVLLDLGCRIFAAVILSVLVQTISALSRSTLISYAVGAVCLGLWLLPVLAPPRSELLAGPLALSDPLRFFDSFCTADIFGFPVLWALVLAVLWSVLAAGCVGLSHKVYHRKGRAI